MGDGNDGVKESRERGKGCLLRSLVVMGCVFLVVLSIHTSIQHKTRSEVEQELARLENSGVVQKKDTPQSLVPDGPPVETTTEEQTPDDANAAEIYTTLSQSLTVETMRSIWKSLRDIFGDRWFTFGDKQISEWTPEQIARLRELVAQHEELIAMLIEASYMPRCEFDVEYDPFPWSRHEHVYVVPSAADLLAIKALLACNDGHPDEALELCGRILDIASHLSGEPSTSVQQTRLLAGEKAFQAMRMILNETDVSDEAARRFIDVLDRAARRDAFISSMEQAALSGVDTFEGLRNRRWLSLDMSFGSAASWDDKLFELAASFAYRTTILNGDELAYARSMDRLIEALRSPPHEGVRELEDLKDNAFQPFGPARFEMTLHPVAGMLTARIWQALASQAEREVSIAEARTVLSLRQYVRDNGAYPDTLVALVPNYLDSVPIDALSGEPLLYRRDGQGFVLHSVGADPAVNDDSSGRISVPDIVWRMYH